MKRALIKFMNFSLAAAIIYFLCLSSIQAEPLPKIIHYIWQGGSLPERYQKNIERVTEINPDYQVQFWTDLSEGHTVAFPLNSRIVTRSVHDVIRIMPRFTQQILQNELNPPLVGVYIRSNPAAAADILRVYILDRFGGFYLDTDNELISQVGFGDIDAHYGFLHAKQNNSIMASVPGHKILKLIEERIESNYQNVYNTIGQNKIATCLSGCDPSLGLLKLSCYEDISDEEKKFATREEFWRSKLDTSSYEICPARNFRRFATMAMTGPGVLLGAVLAYFKILPIHEKIAIALKSQLTVFVIPAPVDTPGRVLASYKGSIFVENRGYQFSSDEFMQKYRLEGEATADHISVKIRNGEIPGRVLIKASVSDMPSFRFPEEHFYHCSDVSWMQNLNSHRS